MKKVLGQILLVCFFGVGISVLSYGQAIDLKGTWVLDTVEIKQIIKGDTTTISHDEFKKKDLELGLFNDLVFSDSQCEVNLDGVPSKMFYVVDNNNLVFQLGFTAYNYTFLIDDVLTRLSLVKKYTPKKEGITAAYLIKGVYVKK